MKRSKRVEKGGSCLRFLSADGIAAKGVCSAPVSRAVAVDPSDHATRLSGILIAVEDVGRQQILLQKRCDRLQQSTTDVVTLLRSMHGS